MFFNLEYYIDVSCLAISLQAVSSCDRKGFCLLFLFVFVYLLFVLALCLGC